jgi:hypothetical protein
MKIRISALDAKFSRYIREIRDKQTCQRCLKQGGPNGVRLENSHFHGRRRQSVRFDPENCTALCFACHRFLGEHPVEHYEFMLKRLGPERFQLLNVRANTPGRPDLTLISLWLDQEFKRLNGTIIGGKA